MKYAFLDLETTGFDPEKDSIIEIAVIVTDENLNEIECFESLVAPDKSTPNLHTERITGISLEMLEGQKLWDDIQNEVQKIVDNAVIIGHNILFDTGFLQANGIDLNPDNYIDTHELARILLINEPSYALEVLADTYNLSKSQAHRAMSDVETSLHLFEFLQNITQTLPQSYINKATGIVKKCPEWIAGSIIIKGNSANKEFTIDQLYCSNDDKDVPEKEEMYVISPMQNMPKSARMLPTPNVLISTNRIKSWMNDSEAFTAKECVFALQCAHRIQRKYRGKNHFNLYFEQYAFWDHVCMRKTDPEYETVLEEKAQEGAIYMTPYAFVELYSMLPNKSIRIQNTTKTIKELLFANIVQKRTKDFISKTIGVQNDAISFLTRDIARDIIEPSLGHNMTPFMNYVLLPVMQQYPEFLEYEFDAENNQWLKDFFTPTDPDMIRWAGVHGDNGSLELSYFSKKSWDEIVGKLQTCGITFVDTEIQNPIKPLCDYFLKAGEWMDGVDNNLKPVIQKPKNLPNIKSEAFTNFLAETAYKAQQKRGGITVVFVQSIRKLTEIAEYFQSHHPHVPTYFEKIYGGTGKFLHMIKDVKEGVVVLQHCRKKELKSLPVTNIIIERFAFRPPHPLTEHLETECKTNSGNWWATWVVPMITADLLEKVTFFDNVQQILFMDSRENARWGKEVIESITGFNKLLEADLDT